MKIGFLGCGAMGSIYAGNLTKAHEVYIFDAMPAVCEAVNVPVIASGGAGTLEHLYEVFTKGNAHAVLAASIFHFGTYTVPQAKEYLAARGIPVRKLVV